MSKTTRSPHLQTSVFFQKKRRLAAWLLAVFFFFSKNLLPAQNIDSLELALQNLPDDTLKIRLLCEAAEAAVPLGPARVQRFANEAVLLCDRLRFLGKTRAYAAVAEAFVFEKNWPSALDFLTRAAAAPPPKNQPHAAARPLTTGAAVLLQLDRPGEALAWLRKALALLPKDDRPRRAAAQNALAVLHGMQGNLDSAAVWVEAAQQTLGQIRTPNPEDNPLIFNVFNDVASSAGSLLLEQGKYAEAVRKFEECLRLDQTAADPHTLGTDYLNLACAHLGLRQTEQAIGFLDRSRALFLLQNDPIRPPVLPHPMSIFFEKNLSRWEAHPALLDSLKAFQSRDYAFQLEAKLRAEQRDAQIREQERDLREAERERWWLLGGLAVFGLLSALLFWQRRKIHRANEALARSNEENRRQAEKLDLLMRELHHRVKNNLQMVSSLLNLQSRQVGDEVAAQALRAGRLRVDAMSLIHQRLYRTEGVSRVNFAEFAHDLVDKIAFAYGHSFENIDVEFHFDPTDAEVDKAMPLGLILNELLTNSFKYAFPAGTRPGLKISLRRQGKNLVFRYEDSGPGLPGDVAPEHSDSFGMRLIRSLSGQLGGKANFRGAGFEVEFLAGG